MNFFDIKIMPAALIRRMLLATFLVAINVAGTVWAGGGHDHGDGPLAASGTASPRLSSQSDLFELVGVVDKGEMKIYLDRYVTNEPITNAKIEVEAGSAKGTALPQPDGSYTFKNELLGKPGTLSVSFVVLAGQDADLLASDLTIGDLSSSATLISTHRPWLRWAAYVSALLLTVLLAIAVWRNRRRKGLLGLVATCAMAVGATATFETQASPGHDHGEAGSAVAASNSPRRLADGGVFLPKASQRQLGVRTISVEEASLATTVELTGRVVLDSNAGGKVQPTQAGRIEPGPRGLPQLGQSVRKGEVLALLRASVGAIDRANQQALSADLTASLELARRRVGRLQQLEGTVPQ